LGKEVSSGPPLRADLSTTAGAVDVLPGESRRVSPGLNEKRQIRKRSPDGAPGTPFWSAGACSRSGPALEAGASSRTPKCQNAHHLASARTNSEGDTTASHRAGTDCRVEEDALGTIEVPADHLWGTQTQRSHLNFPIGVERYRWGRPVIRALGILKKCAALANGELGQLPREREMTHSIAPSSLLTS
jgi:Lyase